MNSESAKAAATLALTRDELEILANALNEVCHGLDLEEFSIRMGADKPEVLKLLNRVAALLNHSP